MADDVPTLTDEDRAALQRWAVATGLGSRVAGVQPLTGGSQNIVVRLSIDDRPMLLRRPPQHPRANSDNVLLRRDRPEVAELLDAYCAAGGRRTTRLDWFTALACFKLGIVIEGTWSRYLAGQASWEAGQRHDGSGRQR